MKDVKWVWSLFVFLLLSNCLLAAKIEFKKEWFFEGEGKVNLTSIIPGNTSFQKIISIEKNEGRIEKKGEELFFRYDNILSGKKKIWIKEIIETNYSNLPTINPGTYKKKELPVELEKLRKKSLLESIAEFFKWIKKGMTYDRELSGVEMNISEILKRKRGVCTHYSLLLIEFLKGLGTDAWMISGFAKGNEGWEEHAWVEAKIGDKIIQMDPTFLEFGDISEERVELYRGEDKKEIEKILSSRKIEVNEKTNIQTIERKKEKESFKEEIIRDGEIGRIYIKNKLPYYRIAKVEIHLPETCTFHISSFYLFDKYEEKEFEVNLTKSCGLERGKRYKIPVLVLVNEEEFKGTFILTIDNRQEIKNYVCISAMVLIGVAYLVIKRV